MDNVWLVIFTTVGDQERERERERDRETERSLLGYIHPIAIRDKQNNQLDSLYIWPLPPMCIWSADDKFLLYLPSGQTALISLVPVVRAVVKTAIAVDHLVAFETLGLTHRAPITTAADDRFGNIFLIFERNKAWYFMRMQTILMKYHALFVIFEEAAKFEISVVCCKL